MHTAKMIGLLAVSLMVSLAASLLFAGCGPDWSSLTWIDPIDGGTDGSVSDSGVPDSGNPDSGNPDSGNPDSGVPDSGNPDSGNPDSGVPDSGNPDSGNPDSGVPDSGVPDSGLPDSGVPDSGVPDGGNLCVPDPCNGRGTCNPANGTCSSCSGNWNPATNCSKCLVGFGGANCDPIALLTVAPLTNASVTLFASTVQVLKWQITCPAGTVNCFVPKQTVSYQFSGGSWTVANQAAVTLYRNGVDVSSTLTWSPGSVVIHNIASEDVVTAGSNNSYALFLTVGGSGSSGNTLVSTLVRGTAPASMLGTSTGLLYSTSAGVSTLFGSPGGPCSASSPEFVFVGVPHTAQTLTCTIADGSGPSDYSTGAEVSSWTAVQQTLTAP